MRNSILTLTCCALVFLLSTTAHSEENKYACLNLGLVSANDSDVDFDSGDTLKFEFENGIALSAAIGGNIEKNIRAEAEISYQKIDLDKASMAGFGSSVSFPVNGDVTCIALLFNGYFDFINSSSLTPFVSAGIGIANVDLSDNITIPGSSYYWKGDDDLVFAYQLGVGVGFSMNKQTMIDLKYRYFATSDPDFKIASAEFSSHNLYVGVRLLF